jgi:prephenate dehydrogenase
MVNSSLAAARPREINRIAVIGLGLMGGSIALRCVERGYSVVGYAPNPKTRNLASAHFEVADTAAGAAAVADLIVLATPMEAMAATT